MPDHELLTIDLPREWMQTLYELALARAVALEASEEIAMCDAGSGRFRKPADALARTLNA